ncbi:MAG: hypothetical protein ACT4P1_11020 [Sporichthyaceae bacterium]
MHPRPRRSLAPRLMLLFAVLTCLLGLGQAGASAQTVMTNPTPTAVVSMSEHGGHKAAGSSLTAVGISPAAGAAGPAQGHGGHGSEAGHELSCMTASAVSATGAVALADAANLLSPAFFVPVSQMRSAVLVVAYPRPPDISALCIQRI